MLFSSAALATRCDEWADTITRRWTSVFVPDRELSGYSVAPTKDEDTYIEDLFADAFPELMVSKSEPSVPAKFRRQWLDPVRAIDDVGEKFRRGDEDNDGIKSLDDLIDKLSDLRLGDMSFREMRDSRKESGRLDLKGSSTSSQMVLTETVTVFEHQPTNSAREKIVISIAL
jgi:hypothetical protein